MLCLPLTLKNDSETTLSNLLANLVMNADDVAGTARSRGPRGGLRVGHVVVRCRDDVSGCHVTVVRSSVDGWANDRDECGCV